MIAWIGSLPRKPHLSLKALLTRHNLGFCRSLAASNLFNETPHRDVTSLYVSSTSEIDNIYLNSSITRLARDGHIREGLMYFQCVNKLGFKPTKFTLCSILNLCSKALDVILGLQVHARIIQVGYEENDFLASKLVDLYAKSGTVIDARRVFNGMRDHDQVSWTSIISGLSQNGWQIEALELFREMIGVDVRPNCFTFASVVSACNKLEGVPQQGTLLHAQVVKYGFELNTFVMSSLIDFYAKQGEIGRAMLLFRATSEKDITLYNAMIAGYSQNMMGEKALELFAEMQERDMEPTDFTFSSLLNACADLASLSVGRQMHSLLCKACSDENVYVVSSLVNMYSKCGDVHKARRAFDRATNRNSVLWTSMIVGYAHNGSGIEGLKLFDQMLIEGGKPDHVCFTGVLTACNHAGLLSEGINYFKLMNRKFGLVPKLDQFACMVDLYGRSGQLRKAKELMHTMPFEPNAVMWSSFLGSCRVYGDLELGKEAATKLFALEPRSVAPYITLASTYAEVGRWDEVVGIKEMIKPWRVGKCSAGSSWVQVGI